MFTARIFRTRKMPANTGFFARVGNKAVIAFATVTTPPMSKAICSGLERVSVSKVAYLLRFGRGLPVAIERGNCGFLGLGIEPREEDPAQIGIRNAAIFIGKAGGYTGAGIDGGGTSGDGQQRKAGRGRKKDFAENSHFTSFRF